MISDQGRRTAMRRARREFFGSRLLGVSKLLQRGFRYARIKKPVPQITRTNTRSLGLSAKGRVRQNPHSCSGYTFVKELAYQQGADLYTMKDAIRARLIFR